MRIVAALFGVAASLALLSDGACAQDRYPSHTVRIIVPTSPGAVTDVLARAIAQALSEAWGQPVIIDNRPGADEMLGDEIVAKADPDGYTLGIVSNGGITAAPQLHREVHYDPLKDFTPIFMLGEVTPVMIVPGKSPVRTVQGAHRARQIETRRTELRLVRCRLLRPRRHGRFQAAHRRPARSYPLSRGDAGL